MDCSMTFDKCLFSKLFSKLSSKLPAIVVRALLWVYEEQTGCVKLGGEKVLCIHSHQRHQTRKCTLASSLVHVPG